MIKKVLLFFLTLYKKMISPYLGNHCRFYPSCSVYTAGSIKRHGVFKGLFLGMKRLLKCQPLHPGGYDPVPDTFKVELKWIQKD